MLREFDVMLCREIGNFPIIIKFVLNLLETFQLGNYPGAQTRPLWRFRKLVRRTYHYDRFSIEQWCASCNKDAQVACPRCDGRVPSTRDQEHATHYCDMCAFLRSVKLEIFLAVKEFFVYQMHCQQSIEVLLQSESGWREHSDLVFLACNDARRLMNRPCRSPKVRHYDVRGSVVTMLRRLELLHDANKISNRRLFKSFALYDLFLAKMKRIAGAQCVIRNWTGCQQPGDFLLAPLRREELRLVIAKHPKVRAMLQCDVPLAHLNGARWCEVYQLSHIDALAQVSAQSGDAIFSALAMVGVSPDGLKLLQELHFNSDERDMPDNATEEIIKRLFVNYPVDFHIAHYYFNSLRLYDQVKVRPLDANTAIAQGLALRQRYHIAPWERIPDDTDHVYLCRHCRILYSLVVDPPPNASLRQRRAVYDETIERGGDMISMVNTPSARGVQFAFYDVERGALMCSRDADSSNTKKFLKTGLLDEPMWIGDKKRASSIRAARESARPCKHEPLEKVPLLGRLLELGGNLYTLCVVCASVCHFTDANMTDKGPTCGRHFRLRPPGIFQNLRQCVTAETQQVRSFAPRMIFPVPQAIRAAPKAVQFSSPSHMKLGVTSTAVIDGSIFAMVQEEIYRKSNSTGAVMRNVRVEPKNTFYAREQERKETEEQPDWTERALVQANSDLFLRNGAISESTLMVCAYCTARCDLRQDFTRLTVDNSDGALVDFLWKKPLQNRGLVDIWLCVYDFNRSLKLLREHPVPLCSQLYFSLSEQREGSLQRRMKRKFKKS